MAGWSRTQKPTALSSGESSEFYSATVCACELSRACEVFRELGYTMTACLKEDASACIGMATRLGPGRLKHVETKHFALQTLGTTGTTNSGQGDDDRAVGRHHDKTLFIPDAVNLGSEDWHDEM